MKLEEEEICPKCNNKFHCSKSKKCWCFEIGLNAEQLELLSEKYESCLCPDCLKEYQSQNKTGH